jgi:hypothetical protein
MHHRQNREIDTHKKLITIIPVIYPTKLHVKKLITKDTDLFLEKKSSKKSPDDDVRC